MNNLNSSASTPNFTISQVYIAGLLLGLCAAFCSVSGMFALFQSIHVGIIMAALEFAKIVSVSSFASLKNQAKSHRILLVSAIIFLSIISTMGVYGFFVEKFSTINKAYTQYTIKSDLLTARVADLTASINDAKAQYKEIEMPKEIEATNLNTGSKNKWMQYSLTQIQAQREAQRSTLQRQALQQKEQVRMSIRTQEDSLSVLKSQLATLTGSYKATEGTAQFQFLTDLTGWSREKVASIFALALALVIDPLAILLMALGGSSIFGMNLRKRRNPTTITEATNIINSDEDDSVVANDNNNVVPADTDVLDSITNADMDAFVVSQDITAPTTYASKVPTSVSNGGDKFILTDKPIDVTDNQEIWAFCEEGQKVIFNGEPATMVKGKPKPARRNKTKKDTDANETSSTDVRYSLGKGESAPQTRKRGRPRSEELTFLEIVAKGQ